MPGLDTKACATCRHLIGSQWDATQNRVQDVLTRLPEDVQRLGVQVRKAIPSILLAVHLYSPDGLRDTLYLSNYATLHIKDVLALRKFSEAFPPALDAWPWTLGVRPPPAPHHLHVDP
jgi:hypothetical protein